jgi:hypothetical protein
MLVALDDFEVAAEVDVEMDVEVELLDATLEVLVVGAELDEVELEEAAVVVLLLAEAGRTKNRACA